jgi:protein O-GlcNAc transferase
MQNAPQSALKAAIEHHQQGRVAHAERAYRSLLESDPSDVVVLRLFGLLCHQTGKNELAAKYLRECLELLPDDPVALNGLGAALGSLGRASDAIAAFRSALSLNPSYVEAANNLGVAFEQRGDFRQAESAFRHATRLDPSSARAHHHLGNALSGQQRVCDAIAAYRRAIELDPGLAPAYNNLAAALCESGEVSEAIDVYYSLRRLRPADAASHSQLLYALHYHDRVAPESVLREHLHGAGAHAEPLYAEIRPLPNDPNPRRRLRVGYVSADFRDHPVARFFEPLLTHHDRTRCEVFCYCDVARPDQVTERLRRLSEHWCDTGHLTDAVLAEKIRRDRIDVLVDQAGHTVANRLLVFARRPAPVQVTFNGYVNTTGLASMDYRITDLCHDPPGTSDHFYSERLFRLPRSCWCFAGRGDAGAPGPLPALRNGFVTFACFNKIAKLSDSAVRVFARVMDAVPGSRLVAVAIGGSHNGAAVRRLEALGIPADRLRVLGRAPTPADYLRRFRDVDISLDTFPFNGITTTCDSLWAGVPVVSLEGRTFVSRAGLGILSAAGFPELVARDVDQFVRTAAALATDFAGLAELRAGLRAKVASSALCDGPAFASAMEKAFRSMWESWCAWTPNPNLPG